jgi:hypothetical protein
VLPVCSSWPIGEADMFPPIYVGATVTVNTNTLVEQCQLYRYIGGNIHMLKDSQCTAMLAAPIMGHDIIFTLFGVYSFSAYFSQLQTGFKGREGVGIERKTSYWPSIIQNSC